MDDKSQSPPSTAFLTRLKQEIDDLRSKDILEISDFSITTWLAVGATLQLLSQACLPTTFGLYLWFPALILAYRLGKAVVNSTRIFTGVFKDVRLGRWSIRLPEPEGSAVTELNDGVVIPLGKLAPGSVEIDDMFQNMWKEAERNRDKWSYLGRSATLFDYSDREGLSHYWLSYWKDLKGLQEFSNHAVHRAGQMAYHKGKFPYMGIAHETYHAPKGHWECIYDNAPPMGMGKTQPVLFKDEDGFKFAEALTKDPPISNMFSRMGRGLPRKRPLVAEFE